MDTVILAKNLIDKSRNILILPSPELQGDSFGSALALLNTLKKLRKNVNIKMGDIPERFRFLTNHLSAAGEDFVISINTDGKEVSRMRYEKKDKDLKIYLALSKGQVRNEDVSFAPFSGPELSSPHPDLLICLGIQSMEQVPQFFWEMPILNIDNRAQNENFGEVNLIEMTSSLSEIVINIIKLMDNEELFDRETATCLLAGIIWSSQNFRNPKTRPRTFEASAFLIEKGANHQEIIQYLYKQKSISQIKLLGKILKNLNFYEPKEIYSANVTKCDFNECQASSKDLAFVLEELRFHFRYLPNLLILWESHASPSLTKGIFYSPDSSLSGKILENFEGASRGNGILFFTKEIDLNIAREKILNIL